MTKGRKISYAGLTTALCVVALFVSKYTPLLVLGLLLCVVALMVCRAKTTRVASLLVLVASAGLGFLVVGFSFAWLVFVGVVVPYAALGAVGWFALFLQDRGETSQGTHKVQEMDTFDAFAEQGDWVNRDPQESVEESNKKSWSRKQFWLCKGLGFVCVGVVSGGLFALFDSVILQSVRLLGVEFGGAAVVVWVLVSMVGAVVLDFVSCRVVHLLVVRRVIKLDENTK
ncbi:MAG: hypothetical protein FWD76_01110 [Firmicutes bacterium]|nr:hypothetical protein [Bacillota bacterium]